MKDKILILHIGNNIDFLQKCSDFLEKENENIEVIIETDPEAGLKKVDNRDFDCIVSSYQISEINGLDFLKKIRERHGDIPFILFTDKGSEKIASKGISLDINEYINKRVDDKYSVLADRIEAEVQKFLVEKKNLELENNIEFILEYTDSLIYKIDLEKEEIKKYGKDHLFYFPNDTSSGWEEYIEDIVYHEDKEKLNQYTKDLIDGEIDSKQIEFRIKTENEEVRWVRCISKIKDIDKNVIVGLVIDITEIKEKERKIKKERRFIDQSIDTLEDIFYVLNKDGEIKRWNNKVNEVTGYKDKEIEQMHALDFFPEDEKQKVYECIQKTIKTGESTIEVDILTKEGERIPHELTGSRLKNEKGDIIGDVGIARNITKRKKREKNLKRQNRHLRDFASLISHELRNPLNIAQINLDFLDDKKPVKKIDNSLDRIEEIIDKLLMYTKMGQTIEETQNVKLNIIARKCWKNVIISDFDLKITEEIEINSDPQMLQHFLENLFKNSVENGASKVRVGSLDNGFYIEDNGTGIPEEKRGKIFDVGYSDKGGTGLGLALVEQIATNHDWNISVKKSNSGGTRFEVYTN